MNKLPNSWKITKLTNVCTRITDGSHFSPKTNETGKPYVTVKDISSSGDIDLLNCKKISIEDFEELVRGNCKPSIGDVLLSKDGTVGKTALVKSEEHFVVLSSLAILSPNKVVNSRYLYLFLNSPSFQEKAIGSKTGAAIKRIVLRTIKEFDIPLPPLPEQTRIVNKLDSLFERIDKSIALLEENIKHTEALMASVLNEVFGNDRSVKLGDVLTLKRGYDLPTQFRKNGRFPLYGANGIIDFHDEFKVNAPGVCTGRSGSIGLVHYVEASYWPLNTSLYVEDFKGNRVKYIYYLLTSCSKELIGQAAFAAVPTLDRKKAHEFISVKYHSNLSTQDEISNFLDNMYLKKNKLMSEQQSKLSFLKALKASLLDKAFKGEL